MVFDFVPWRRRLDAVEGDDLGDELFLRHVEVVGVTVAVDELRIGEHLEELGDFPGVVLVLQDELLTLVVHRTFLQQCEVGGLPVFNGLWCGMLHADVVVVALHVLGEDPAVVVRIRREGAHSIDVFLRKVGGEVGVIHGSFVRQAFNDDRFEDLLSADEE